MPKLKTVVDIIDDDPSVRTGLRRVLESYGFEARLFASAREFLAAGIPGPDTCVLIDMIMPEMDGLRLQEELVRAGSKAPVIFITAHDDAGLRERARRSGAAGFLRKPVDAEELMEAIKGALAGGKD